MPRVFVVGCMKAGTTIMFDYLTSHASLVGARNKEVHYFTMHSHRGLAWYARQFPEISSGQLLVDASPTYFHLGVEAGVPTRIATASPGAKIIVILRDPVERAVSHFRHLRRYGEADILGGLSADDFFDWDLAEVVTENGRINYLRHLVLSFSVCHRALMHYWSIFQHDLLVVQNHVLAARGQEVMDTVFAHVGVESLQSDLFATSNYASDDTDELSAATRERLTSLFATDYKSTLDLAAHINGRRMAIDHG